MRRIGWFGVYALLGVGLVLLDQWTKSLALTYLAYQQPVAVAPFFNFTLTFNTGSLFGIFHQYGGMTNVMLTLLTIVIALILTIWLWRVAKQFHWLALGITFIIAGALGNLLDRLQYGMVVDFIDWYIGQWHWPTFNIADASIVIGIVFLVILWKPKS